MTFPSPARRLILLLIFVLLAGSCTRFVYRQAYNNADFLVMRELNGYFDLSSSRYDTLSQRVSVHHHWHRRSEMPRYATTLREFRNRAQRGLTGADVDWLFARGRNFRDAVYRRIYPDSVSFLKTLQPAQVEYLSGIFEEKNAELVTKIRMTREERLAEKTRKGLDFLEDWTGGLTQPQRDRFSALMRDIPETERSRLRYRRERQKEFLAILPASGGNAAELQSALEDWLHRPDQNIPAYYERDQARWREATKQLMLKMQDELSDQQKRNFLQRLDGLIADLDDLARGV